MRKLKLLMQLSVNTLQLRALPQKGLSARFFVFEKLYLNADEN